MAARRRRAAPARDKTMIQLGYAWVDGPLPGVTFKAYGINGPIPVPTPKFPWPRGWQQVDAVIEGEGVTVEVAIRVRKAR